MPVDLNENASVSRGPSSVLNFTFDPLNLPLRDFT